MRSFLKKSLKTLSLLLALLMLLSTLAACSESEQPETKNTQKPTATAEQEPGAELDENGYVKDSLPSDLNFNQEMLILSADNQKWHYWAPEDDATSVGKAVWQRNQTVEERLGVALNFLMPLGS